MKICLLCIFFVCFPFYYGCSLLSERVPPGTAAEGYRNLKARDLLNTLQKQNSGLDSFKGIGFITLQKNGAILFKERLAWIGARPADFLIVVLVSGHPAIKLSGNGKWLFYYNPYDHKNTYQKIKSRDPSLKRLISVPLRVSDFLSLLAGRIPILRHYSVELATGPDKDGDILILKKWRQIRQKIYFPRNGTYPYKTEIFNRDGTLNYGVQLEQTEVIEGYTVPMKLTVFANEKEGPVICQLSIDQYWPNVAVIPSTFILPPPE